LALSWNYYYFALEVTDYPQVKLMSSKAALNMTYLNSGFDFGLKTFLTSSDEEEIDSPLYLKQSQNDRARLQKQFARTKKGSSKHRSLKRQIASLHETVANKRRDWFYKLTHDLTHSYDYALL
jgi:putative transposase